jgi:hypothetical protein
LTELSHHQEQGRALELRDSSKGLQACNDTRGKVIPAGTKLQPRWCLADLTRMQWRWIQKLRAHEIKEKEM